MSFVEHKLLQGQGAGKWLPFARSKVAILHERAQAMGITALSQRWTVEGGMVEIAVRVVGDQRYIHIRRKTCPPFTSGLADAILNPLLAAPPLVPGAPVIETTVAGDPDHPQYAFRRFFPSARDAAAINAPRAWRDEPRLARNIDAAKQILSLQSGAVVALKSGQFTAEMRKVVQVLQGMNEVIPYSPLYALTHGVFVAENGVRWVVEITVNGVVAWVMNVCTAQPVTAENGDVLLPYTPLPAPKPTSEEIPAAIAAGTFKILADSAMMLDFYTKTPFFPHCGWAFSATGHEAANVCFYFEGATARSSLYNITITEDENVPLAATVMRLEDGYLFGTTNVHMKYPKPDGKLYSFDTRGPVPVVSNCPVYCWYDSDSLVVARHEFTAGTTTTVVNDGNPGTNPCDSDFGRDLRTGSFTQIQSPVISIAGHTTPSRMHNYSGGIARYDKSGVAGGVLANFSVAGGMAVTEVDDTSVYTRSSALDVEGVRATLIIPFYDREAAYIAVERQLQSSSGSETYQQRFAIATQSHFSMCLETCAAIPDRCINVLAAAGGQANTPTACGTGGSGMVWSLLISTAFYTSGVPGGIINSAVQDGGTCAAIEQPLQFNSPDITLPPLPTDVKTYSFDFIASDNAGDSLPIPTSSPQALVSFIGEGETQRAVAIRDAFAGDRYILSPNTVPELGPAINRDDAGYPLVEVLGGPAWIGVP